MCHINIRRLVILSESGTFACSFLSDDVIMRSHDIADFYSILVPVGLDRGDDRTPDAVTSFPFRHGKSVAWDATCTVSFSAGNLYTTSLNRGSALSAAESLETKYSQLEVDFDFVPLP